MKTFIAALAFLFLAGCASAPPEIIAPCASIDPDCGNRTPVNVS